MRLFFYSAAMVFGFMAVAWAQGCGTAHRETVRCFYSPDAAKYYPDEARMFGAGSRVKVCHENGTDVPHLFATPVKLSDAGVCFFWVRDMDEHMAPPQFPKRTLMMSVAHGACPIQDDDSYILNSDVPDGVFAALLKQWNAGGFSFSPLSDEDKKRGGIDFNALLKTEHGRKRFPLYEIAYSPVLPDILTSDKRGGSFTLAVSDKALRETYIFWVDWLGGAFQVVNSKIVISGC